MGDKEVKSEEVSSQSEQAPAQDEILLYRIASLERKILQLQIDLDSKNKELNRYYQRRYRYRRILEQTVIVVYDALINGYHFFRFYRCQDCFKRKFRTRLYKEHETYARIYLCPSCLITANQLPKLKFVKVNSPA